MSTLLLSLGGAAYPNAARLRHDAFATSSRAITAVLTTGEQPLVRHDAGHRICGPALPGTPSRPGARMIIDDPAKFSCGLPGCDGPRSGVSINNLPFDECPDVVELGEGEDVGELAGTGELGDTVPLTVNLPGGRGLDAAACDALLMRREGTVVGIVAAPEVGKTTLISTIYELLHRRRMADFGFAGSETLRAYEERSSVDRQNVRSRLRTFVTCKVMTLPQVPCISRGKPRSGRIALRTPESRLRSMTIAGRFGKTSGYGRFSYER